MNLDIMQEFTLQDAHGVDHDYMVQLMPATKGAAVSFELMALVVEPLAPMLGGVVHAAMAAMDRGGASSKASDVLGDIDVGVMLEGLDFAAVGAAISAVVARIPQPLVRTLMGTVHRDGQPMSKQSAFDQAYTGNYMELMRALGKVIQANHFLPASDTIANALGAARGLAATAPTARPRSGNGGGSPSTLPGAA